MNPVDQAFLNAYAKKRTISPTATPATTQSKPLQDSSGTKNLRSDNPKSVAQIPSPHLANEPIPAVAQSTRSPSIVVPSREFDTSSAVASPTTAASKTSTSDPLKRQLRFDSPTSSDTVVPGPKLSSPFPALEKPRSSPPKFPEVIDRSQAAATVNVVSTAALTSETAPSADDRNRRRTLTSYLQQSRRQTESEIGPNSTAPVQALPMTAPTLNAPAVAKPIKLPNIASRWSPAASNNQAARRIDPASLTNGPVVRNPELDAWSTKQPERGFKATADSSSIPAVLLNSNPLSTPIESSNHSSVRGDATASPIKAPHLQQRQLAPDAQTTNFRKWESTSSIEATHDATARIASESPAPAKTHATPDAAGPHFRRPAQSLVEELKREAIERTSKENESGPSIAYSDPSQAAGSRSMESPSNVPVANAPLPKVSVPIQPLWEVDAFFWPATVDNLLGSQAEVFHEVGLHFQHVQSQGLRVLGITGGERGVGRSTVALCLAKTIAMMGLRVALVDGDYECPSLLDHFNMAVDHGWQDCVSNNVPLDEVIIQSIEDNIALVPLTDSISPSLIGNYNARINKLLKRLSQAYDFVIVDSNRITAKNPRLLGTGEDAILDAAIVVVDAELSLRQRVDAAIDLVREQGVESIGIVENFQSSSGV